MIRRYGVLLVGSLLVALLLTACQSESDPTISYDPDDLLFTGGVALDIVGAITENFPYRASEELNNELAADWLDAVLTQLGWQCISDEWQVINYSRPLPLQNIICQLPGESREQIILMADYDQSPGTVEGADGNASGVAVMLLLAQILASEQPWPYTMVVAATDGGAYGSLGAQRFINTHADPERIIAAVSLQNLGLDSYNGLGLSVAGLSDGYGPIWLQVIAQEAARTAGDLWVPQMQSALRQTMVQAVPLSRTGQGPLVAVGVPAIAMFGLAPEQLRDDVRDIYSSPADTFDRQSEETLAQSGRVAEALIRQLQGMTEYPDSFAPYLAYDGGGQVVPPYVFYLLALALAALFFLASYLSGSRLEGGYLQAMIGSLPHYLSLWLPFVASILLLYFFVAIGLLEEFDTYPATPKDPALTNPRWFVFIIWLIALWEFLQIGLRLEAVYLERHPPRPHFDQIRTLVFLIIGLVVVLVMLKNPISAFIFVPTVAWLFIGDRHGLSRFLDVGLFLLGGLFFAVAVYFIGYTIIATRLTALWYMLLGLSNQIIDFWSASLIFGVAAAGLALLVSPPATGRRKAANETDFIQEEPDPGDKIAVDDRLATQEVTGSGKRASED